MKNILLKSLTFIVILFVISGNSYSQLALLNSDSRLTKSPSDKIGLKLKPEPNILKAVKPKINIVKTTSIAAFTIGAGVWLHNYQRNSWWAGQRGQFHIQNDWDYSMSADKCGHFFDGAFIHKLFSGSFEWAGFDKKSAMWLGALSSLAYMTDIEVEDGFATSWGFSPGDEACNTLGAFYPVVQYYVEPLQEFNFKWSYFPSDEIRNGNKNGAFLDDYNGQTMWLSIGVYHFLPKSIKKYWPDFINIALGYGVKDYTDYAKQVSERLYCLRLRFQKADTR